jgi:hypothetical protein
MTVEGVTKESVQQPGGAAKPEFSSEAKPAPAKPAAAPKAVPARATAAPKATPKADVKADPKPAEKPVEKPAKKESVQQLKNRLRNEAEREILNLPENKERFYDLAGKKFEEHGLKFERRLSDEEKAAKEIAEKLAKYPSLRKQFGV